MTAAAAGCVLPGKRRTWGQVLGKEWKKKYVRKVRKVAKGNFALKRREREESMKVIGQDKLDGDYRQKNLSFRRNP